MAQEARPKKRTKISSIKEQKARRTEDSNRSGRRDRPRVRDWTVNDSRFDSDR
ncbi:MAG: hypothetical protein ACI9G1_003085 [Pirellulaceae bacterium]|jgi:hypothetical protein